MDLLGWLGQPGNAVFIPLIAAAISGVVALATALMNLMLGDAKYRRLSSLEKLVALSKECGSLDNRVKKIIQYEIEAEAKSRYRRRNAEVHYKRWLWLKLIPIATVSAFVGNAIWIADAQDQHYWVQYFWEPPPQATAATIAYLYILLALLTAYALWSLVEITAFYIRKRRGQFTEYEYRKAPKGRRSKKQRIYL